MCIWDVLHDISFELSGRFLTHWLPELFAKNAFFGHFWWFSGWISAKLASIWSNRHWQHSSVPFLPLASHFMTFWLGHEFWTRKWTMYLGFLILEFFFRFSFFSFSFCCSDWPVAGLACSEKNFQESVIEMGKFDHGVAMCSGRKFCSKFFTQLFEHFWAYLSSKGRSLWPGHYWKDLFLLQKLTIHDVNFGQKWWC